MRYIIENMVPSFLYIAHYFRGHVLSILHGDLIYKSSCTYVHVMYYIHTCSFKYKYKTKSIKEYLHIKKTPRP